MGDAADKIDELAEEIRSLPPRERAEVAAFVRRIRAGSDAEGWSRFALEQWEPGPGEETTYTIEEARDPYHVES